MMNTASAHAERKSPFGFITLLICFVLFFWYVLMPATNRFVMAGETGAGGYAIIADAFPTLKVSTQELVKARFSKGYLTRTDVSELISAMLPEKGQVQTSPAPDFGDEEQAYGPFQDMWMRMRGEHATYKSKTALSQLIARPTSPTTP